MNEIKQSLNSKIEAAHSHLASEFNAIRSGRANAGLLDKITVDVYGQATPLNNIATITSPDPKQLVVQPWDKNNVVAIEKAISAANIGLSVANEGDKVRATMPPLSNERREELIKLTNRLSEEAKVSIRNARRDALEDMEKQADSGGVSDDDKERFKKECQGVVDEAIKKVDEMAGKKSEELRLV